MSSQLSQVTALLNVSSTILEDSLSSVAVLLKKSLVCWKIERLRPDITFALYHSFSLIETRILLRDRQPISCRKRTRLYASGILLKQVHRRRIWFPTLIDNTHWRSLKSIRKSIRKAYENNIGASGKRNLGEASDQTIKAVHLRFIIQRWRHRYTRTDEKLTTRE